MFPEITTNKVRDQMKEMLTWKALDSMKSMVTG